MSDGAGSGLYGRSKLRESLCGGRVWHGDVMEEHFWNVSCGTNPTKESIQTSQCFNTAVRVHWFPPDKFTGTPAMIYPAVGSTFEFFLGGWCVATFLQLPPGFWLEKLNPISIPYFNLRQQLRAIDIFSSFWACQRWCTQTALAFEHPSFSTIAIILPWPTGRVQHNPSCDDRCSSKTSECPPPLKHKGVPFAVPSASSIIHSSFTIHLWTYILGYKLVPRLLL